VYVHVGEPKTGTTFLQQVMWTNKATLLDHGLLVPGARPVTHWRAALDLREVAQLPNDPWGSHQGAWAKLAGQARRAPRIGVISHELLAAVDQEQAERGVRSLDPAEVHIVLTVRDIGTLLPAEWQETVKHRNTRAWEDWLADVIDVEADHPDRRQFWFWKVHDTLEILRAWSTLVPPERVHVITTPPRGSDPDLLWKRFAALLGIDPGVVDTSRARSNASLGLADVEMLRRVNMALPDELPDWFYMHNVKDALAHGALAGRGGSAARLGLPADREKWAAEHADRVIAELRATDYDIIGDLTDLLPHPASEATASPSESSAQEMLDAAVVAITSLLGQIASTQGVRPGQPSAPDAPAGPVKSRLIALSKRYAVVHRLRRAYWALANAARQLRSTARPELPDPVDEP
jgi:hypothetical protein